MGKFAFYTQDQGKVCLSPYDLIEGGRGVIHQGSICILTAKRLKNPSFVQLIFLDIMILSSSCLFRDLCLSILMVQHFCIVCFL